MPHAPKPQLAATTSDKRRLRSVHNATLAIVAAAALSASGSALAHHSFAMFDKTQTVIIVGTVKEFQWTNPHAWIELMVTTPDGMKQYSIEAFNVRTLRNAGWKYDTLNPGDKVSVSMNPLRNGAAGGSLVSVTLPDGRTLQGF
jgi:Family of unknown function (DUF6152)